MGVMNYRYIQRKKKSFAAELSEIIWVKTRTTETDGDGGVIETWTDRGWFYASVAPFSAEQKMQYKTLEVEATHLIQTRLEAAISEHEQVLFEGRVFDVLTVDKVDSDVLAVTCKELR